MNPSNVVLQKCASFSKNLKDHLEKLRETDNQKFQKLKFANKLMGLQKVKKALKFQLEKKKKKWNFHSFLNIIFLIQIFLQKLKNNSPLRKADKLERNQLKLIGNVYDFENEEVK